MRYFLFVFATLSFAVGLGWSDSGVAQAQEPERAGQELDLTGNLVINAADASMVAEAWQSMMEEEGCELSSQASRSLFAQRDMDGNGCLSVVDVQKVLAHWGEAADAEKPLASLRRRNAASGGTFVVNVASDESDSNAGDGVCQTATGNCTLRAAIEEANVSNGSQTIHFDIRNGDGSCPDVVTIYPSSTLVVDDNNYEGTTIDGYTQCNASPNTGNPVGNAQIKIEIVGNGINNEHGVELKSPYHVVKGLAIYNFDPQLHLSSAASHNRIQGNFLGTNADNTFLQWGNYTEGLHLRWGASYNIIGCGSYDQSNTYQPCQTQAEFNAARNIVGGANGDGITIQGDIMHTRFIGNYVGVAQDGSTALRNSSDGIDFGNGPQHNWVGGILPGEANVVSANRGDGIELSHSTETKDNNIVGNYVGVDATGMQSLPNEGNGITLEDTVDGTKIYENVISGNGANGIRAYMLVTNAQIYDNWIGLAGDGATPMGNGSFENALDGQAGIYVMGESHHINIYLNRIAYNGQQGIHLSNRSDYPSGFGRTFYNTISQNSIYQNGTSGIYLNPQEDPDTGQQVYPNDNISAPTITSATLNNISGTACANCTVELFIADKTSANDASGENNGEGQTYLASTTTDSNGNFSLSIANLVEGQILTATATDNLGNSSAFARNVAVTSSSVPTATPTIATTPSPTPTSTPIPTVTPTPALDGSLQLNILKWSDDAEERLSDGKTYRGSSDLEMIDDRSSNGEQLVGLRYQNAGIPQGATITRAYLEFTADETQSETTFLTIRGEASDNAERIRYQVNNLSSRSTTSAALEWQNVPAWNLIHETHQTPDFPAVIQEIVDRPGWVSGNALVLLITGSGHRTAESYDGSPSLAPVLHIEYTFAGPDLPPTVPTSTPEAIPAYEEGDLTVEPILWIPLILR